jgi:hypothetical protein
MSTLQRIVLGVALLAIATSASAKSESASHHARHTKRHHAKLSKHPASGARPVAVAVPEPRPITSATSEKAVAVADVSNPVCIGACAAPDRSQGVGQNQIAPSIAFTTANEARDQIGAQKQISAPSEHRTLAVPNVTSTAEGRSTSVQPVAGKDRCDDVGRENSEDCKAIPEAHLTDFERPRESHVWPEALYIDPAGRSPGNPTSNLPASVLNTGPVAPNSDITIVTTPAPR